MTVAEQYATNLRLLADVALMLSLARLNTPQSQHKTLSVQLAQAEAMTQGHTKPFMDTIGAMQVLHAQHRRLTAIKADLED